MNDGATACANGVAGACSHVYFPSFTWTAAIMLLVTLFVVLFSPWFRQPKYYRKIGLVLWVLLVIGFGVLIFTQAKTGAELNRDADAQCHLLGLSDCENKSAK